MEQRPMLVGQRIRELRERAQLTQSQLGACIGFSDAHISMMEKGRRKNVETWIVALLARSKPA